MKITSESINKESANSRKTPSSNKKPNDKKPKNKEPNDKKSMSPREKKIVAAVCVVGILGAVMIKNVFFPTPDTPTIVDKDEKPKEDTKKSNNTKQPVDTGDEVVEEAKEGLERPDEPIAVEDTVDAKARLQEGLDYVKSLGLEDFVPSRCAAWQHTQPEKARQVQEALDLGYTMDVENSYWFNSDAKQQNVYQFVVKMHKDGAEDIAFNGNYLTGVRSINIGAMIGELDTSSLSSPGDGPQAKDPGVQ